MIERIARQRRSALKRVDVDFHFEYQPPATSADPSARRQRRGPDLADRLGRDRSADARAHQAHNAAVALASLDVLADEGLVVGREAVTRGFAALRWPARIEVVAESPWLVIDGAHNVAAARALAETLRTCFPPRPGP